MQTRSKLLLAGLAAAMMLTFAVGSASANRLSTNAREFYVFWDEPGSSGRLTFEGVLETSCEVTLLGSFHSRTIVKRPGALIGSITHVDINNCEAGTEARILSLPWHVTYEAFTGTLPNITAVRILLLRAAFEIDFGSGVICLGISDASDNASGEARIAAGNVTSLIADSDQPILIDDVAPSTFCDLSGSGRFVGTADVATSANGTGTATIRLI